MYNILYYYINNGLSPYKYNFLFSKYTNFIAKIMIIFLCWHIGIAESFAKDSISFWNQQQKGTNFFNNHEEISRYKAAKEININFVRLAPNKWLNGRNQKDLGNFLIGSQNSPTTIPIKADVEYLKSVLDMAQQQNIKVILTMLSLPHSRWVQHSSNGEERIIWESFKAQDDAIEFWVNLVKEISQHPALAGINIRNEPSPEKSKYSFQDWYDGDYEKWYQSIKGTPADLNLFYNKVVKAIRKVDKDIVIVIESGFYATPWGFKVLEKIADDNILYSFHMYEPYQFTSNKNKGKFKYGDKIPTGEKGKVKVLWNKEYLENFLQPVLDFQKKYNIPSNRIIVSEFGGYRYNQNMDLYLKDLIDIFNKNQWHWAFYSFREDDWDGMDYELGDKKPGWGYWKSIENKQIPSYENIDSKLFNIILNGLQTKSIKN